MDARQFRTDLRKRMARWGSLHSVVGLSLGCAVVCLVFVGFASIGWAQEIRDVRPPVEVPDFPWGWFVAGLAWLAFMIGAWLFWRTKKLVPALTPEPWDVALKSLDVLRGKDLPGQGRYKELYTELSGIARVYIERRFQIRAAEMTTEEFFARVRSSDLLKDDQNRLLEELLRTADMVKFARHQPGFEDAARGFECVHRFVQDTRLDAVNILPEGSGQKKS